MSNEKLPPSAYGEAEILRHFHNFDVERGRYKFIIDQIPPNSKILEVGCFLGRYSQHFTELGHQVTGIDLSPEVIKKGKELFPDLDLRCVNEIWEDDLLKGEYDIVVASEVIEHVLHPQDFLKLIRKALKKNGLLLLTTQNSNAIHYRLQMLVGKFRWDPTHLRLYSRPELEAELKDGGFMIRKTFGIPINPLGPQKIPRLFAYYAAKIYQNFCWTWGMVASPSTDFHDERIDSCDARP
jgi:2-polyprenyl-3-methyl-5-hydroxy-6-metoxy-1,4-benzoquinol methylase